MPLRLASDLKPRPQMYSGTRPPGGACLEGRERVGAVKLGFKIHRRFDRKLAKMVEADLYDRLRPVVSRSRCPEHGTGRIGLERKRDGLYVAGCCEMGTRKGVEAARNALK